jgi:hypothetical protein
LQELHPPSFPIPFVSKVKKMDNVDGLDAEKYELIKLEFFMDPDKPASKYSWQFSNFKDGCSEEFINWVMVFREIENLMTMKDPADKTRMLWTLLKGQALSYIEHHLKKRVEGRGRRLSGPRQQPHKTSAQRHRFRIYPKSGHTCAKVLYEAELGITYKS